METPDLETPELSQFDNKENEAIIDYVEIIEFPPQNEISFKITPVIKMASATPAQAAPTVVESAMKDTPKRVTNTPKSIKKSPSAKECLESFRKSATTPKSTKIPNVTAKKSGVRSNPWPSKVLISPIKKAALQKAFAGQVINLKKTPVATLKHKSNTNMKLNRYEEMIF